MEIFVWKNVKILPYKKTPRCCTYLKSRITLFPLLNARLPKNLQPSTGDAEHGMTCLNNGFH